MKKRLESMNLITSFSEADTLGSTNESSNEQLFKVAE